MGLVFKTTNGVQVIPFASEITKKQRKVLEAYMPKSGGVFENDIQVPAKSTYDHANMRGTYVATEAQIKAGVTYALDQVASNYSLKTHNHANATQSSSGFMSMADKIKLDGIEAGANKYILPIATSTVLGGVKSQTTGTTANRDYKVQINSDGTMKVNVPWVDTNTHIITGVKGDNESSYRTGNVNLTCDNIGAAPASHSHAYLPLAGGTMTGKLNAHNGLTLSSGTSNHGSAMKYYLGIKSYSDGGDVVYRSASEVKEDLGINSKADANHGHSSLNGFEYRTEDTTWGNRTGSHVIEWVVSGDTANALKFRRNNPSTGSVSILVDGTIYVNEGQDRVYCASYKPTPADIGAAPASHTHSQYLTSHQSLINYVDLTSAQTITGHKNFNGGIHIGTASSAAGKITFGDGNYVFLKEFSDDSLVINASSTSSKGLYFSRGNSDITAKPSSFSSSFAPAIAGYLSGSTLYLFTMGS